MTTNLVRLRSLVHGLALFAAILAGAVVLGTTTASAAPDGAATIKVDVPGAGVYQAYAHSSLVEGQMSVPSC